MGDPDGDRSNPVHHVRRQHPRTLGFYQSVFGGKVEVTTFGDFNVPDAPADAVMNAALTTDEFAIYAYDAMPGQDLGDQSRIRIAIVGDDLEALTVSFDALAHGGRVLMALAKQMWGATYGEVVDQYGIEWMLNVSAPKS